VSEPPAAFEQLFRDYYDPVYRYATRRVPAEAVQDVVSETFLAAWRRYDELRGDPLPWLLGVARRIAANQLRGDARRVALTDRLSAERTELVSSGGDRSSRLALALAELSERDREALLLVAWDGLEYRLAAHVVGCRSATFAVRKHRARRRLERALAANEQRPGNEQRPVNVNQQARSNS
jgi:RNA polymerase sigma-70 factor (ECF subfamily)